MFTAKLGGTYRFPYTLCVHTYIASPVVTITIREVHLLQLMNLHNNILKAPNLPDGTLGYLWYT